MHGYNGFIKIFNLVRFESENNFVDPLK